MSAHSWIAEKTNFPSLFFFIIYFKLLVVMMTKEIEQEETHYRVLSIQSHTVSKKPPQI
jgi:hypothetical protein